MAYRSMTIVFSTQEVKDLALAWGLISLAFAIVFMGGPSLTTGFLVALILAALTVGIGFLAHELAHKIIALRYGCNAGFQANKTMLFLAVLMSFFGFVFAAPGAVWFTGHVTQKQRGLIAAAGPAANIILAVLFLPLTFILPVIAGYGFFVNAFLALFNLLPFPGFDGVKVWSWNKAVYALLIITSGALVFISHL